MLSRSLRPALFFCEAKRLKSFKDHKRSIRCLSDGPVRKSSGAQAPSYRNWATRMPFTRPQQIRRSNGLLYPSIKHKIRTTSNYCDAELRASFEKGSHDRTAPICSMKHSTFFLLREALRRYFQHGRRLPKRRFLRAKSKGVLSRSV